MDSLIKIIDNYRVSNLVYVSCNPVSLCRDLIKIQESGYVVEKVCCVDQFCHTPHLESVVKLRLKED